MRRSLTYLALAALLFIGPTYSTVGQLSGQDPDLKLEPFDKVVKGAKEYDGLFKLYHKGENLYAEIRPDQLDRPFLLPIAVARGGGMGGFTLNFEEQWVLLFQKVGEGKLHLVRRNVRFKANAGSPVAKAVETTYTDSVLLALKVVSIHPGRMSYLINFNDIFMQDFAQLGLGSFDANRSTWHKIKAFPRNIELQVAATFTTYRSGWFFGGRDDSVIDDRGNTVVVHYGLCHLPDDGYQPRLADDRVGYFLSVVKDFSSDSKDTSFLRYVNRWRLERADTDHKNKDKLSVPKKKIVYWIEKSVPFEYRAYVREGILEWNKAFEKIGFRDAIEVRQQENEDFDPEDMNYNTFRWITMGAGFAMGPSRANPLTGEILDADIIFDADLVRFWKQDARMFVSGAGMEEPASKIQALRHGLGLPQPPSAKFGMSWDSRMPGSGEAGPASAKGIDPAALKAEMDRAWAVRQGVCQCGSCLKYELGLMAMTLMARDDDTKKGDPIPEEFIGQAIKYVVMHEVGHTLGLRHNFKGSTMLKNEDLHNTEITRKHGLAGSVMDYLPANIAPKGTKQGDFFTTTIGPYDYWAIEYAYKPLEGGTEGELEKLREIAKRGAKFGHDYGTDEDMFGTSDPLINAFDLGADPMKFGMDRMLLAAELMKTLADKVVEKGEGYQRMRLAFDVLLMQYGDAAFLTAQFVGGEYAHRDHRDDPDARDPLVPVQAVKQRAALKFLQEHLLTDKHFKFPPAVLRKLAADRWSHWGNDRWALSSVDYPLHDRVLMIQKLVLWQLLHPATLRRIQDNALKTDDTDPLSQAEVFRTLTDGIWGEYPKDPWKEKTTVSSTAMRRNLQREYLKELSNLVLGKSGGGFFFFGRPSAVTPDARNLARKHLREIYSRLAHVLNNKQATVEETTLAHIEECRLMIDRVQTASMQMSGN
jgi:hypothetical protein